MCLLEALVLMGKPRGAFPKTKLNNYHRSVIETTILITVYFSYHSSCSASGLNSGRLGWQEPVANHFLSLSATDANQVGGQTAVIDLVNKSHSIKEG